MKCRSFLDGRRQCGYAGAVGDAGFGALIEHDERPRRCTHVLPPEQKTAPREHGTARALAGHADTGMRPLSPLAALVSLRARSRRGGRGMCCGRVTPSLSLLSQVHLRSPLAMTADASSQVPQVPSDCTPPSHQSCDQRGHGRHGSENGRSAHESARSSQSSFPHTMDASSQAKPSSAERRCLISHSTHFPHMSHPILPIFQNLIRCF